MIMDAVCEIHTGCAGPYCMVEQIYNKETGETRYSVLETYSEVDTIFTKSFPSSLSIQYADDLFEKFDKSHVPEKKESKTASKSPVKSLKSSKKTLKK
jgi:hypothetical protein